jgi:SAM-dependent methyltransferase
MVSLFYSRAGSVDRRIDFGRTAEDYGRHRRGFPAEILGWLARIDAPALKGQRVLDIGTGTGSLARLFAGAGAHVIGLDRARELLQTAAVLDAEAAAYSCYAAGTAEHLPVKDGAFDVVTVGQCWHWFDRSQAAAEGRRVLIPGGRLVIAHFDWIPWPGGIAAATENLIATHNPSWSMGGGNGLYPAWYADLTSAGFVRLRGFTFDVEVPYTQSGWRGRIRASAGVAASLDPLGVEKFDRALADLLRREFPDEVLPVLHRVFVVIGESPSR